MRDYKPLLVYVASYMDSKRKLIEYLKQNKYFTENTFRNIITNKCYKNLEKYYTFELNTYDLKDSIFDTIHDNILMSNLEATSNYSVNCLGELEYDIDDYILEFIKKQKYNIIILLENYK